MNKVSAWLAAARLRTLPLSVSGIIVGASLGSDGFLYKSLLFWFAILTTIAFQVLSNFANDYGDGVKGTDRYREGEKRMVASGIISKKEMKRGIYIAVISTILLTSLLIFTAFGRNNFLWSFVFFNLGILAIVAAVKYTIGENAHGYIVLGDVFVFIFFGLLSVLGTYFLFAKSLHGLLLFPAITIGFFSIGVLNLNNMRDIHNDAKSGKHTLVVKWGSENAKKYHCFLLVAGMVSAMLYTYFTYESPKQFLYVIAFIPLVVNIVKVIRNKNPSLLDAELKKVALSTFLFAILFSYTC